MDGWSLFWWAAGSAGVLYGIALGAIAVARRRSEKVAQRTARFWRHELWITTWILAAPGLVAAGYGVLIMIGFVLLPLGLAVGVIATRVSLGKRSVMYGLPLIFVGVVDLIMIVSLILAREPTSAAGLGAALGFAAYLGLATANAWRIFTRGRKNSRDSRTPPPPDPEDRQGLSAPPLVVEVRAGDEPVEPVPPVVT